jgi:uncharacterized delta-60 repeat protein
MFQFTDRQLQKNHVGGVMSQHFVQPFETLENRIQFNGGSLDPAFNGGQIVQTTIAGGSSIATDVKTLPDGSILAVGVLNKRKNNHSINKSELIVVKYNFNGSLDTSFGAGGEIVATPRGLKSHPTLALTPDGGFLVGGSTDVFNETPHVIVKFSANGTIDTTFGSNGEIKFTADQNVQSMPVDPSGRIYVADFQAGPNQTEEGALIRYSAKGELDTTFSGGGTFAVLPPRFSTHTTATMNAIEFDSQGRILTSLILETTDADTNTHDDQGFIYRLLDSGKVDKSFDDRGVQPLNVADHLIAVRPDGGLVLAGEEDVFIPGNIEELRPDLTLDPFFGNNGKISSVSQQPVAFGTDGSLLVGSGIGAFSVSRLQSNGSPDTNFGASGKLTLDSGDASAVNAVTFAPDTTIVAAGDIGVHSSTDKTDTRTFTIARILPSEMPVAQLVPKTLKTSSKYLTFNVEIRSSHGVDVSTLDNNDLRLFNKDSIPSKVQFSTETDIGDGVIEATYRALAPSGSKWTAADNGTYTVRLLSKAITNISGVVASAGNLGTLRVKIA